MGVVLEVQDLIINRGGPLPVLEIDRLTVEDGEVLTVIGPNGSGKSTLLLTLSRLLKPDQGQIIFRGQALSRQADLTYRRRIGLVLQDPLLLDLSVFDNVATGLRFRGAPREKISRKVNMWLDRFGVAHLRNRRAHSLSGGEAQRVSLARALVLEPELLMLDEPFSALDAPTRSQLLEDFQVLLASTHTTTLFITHDLNEALFLGKRVVVLLNGRIRQVGPPDQVFANPADPEVAKFVGVETVIGGQVIDSREGVVTVKAHGVEIQVMGAAFPGQEVFLTLRPEDVTLWTGEALHDTSARNILTGSITRLIPQGALMKVQIDCGFPLVAAITRASAREMNLAPGQQVGASFKASTVHLIRRQDIKEIPPVANGQDSPANSHVQNSA